MATNDDIGDDSECSLEQWAEFFRFKKGRDSPSDVRNALLVIAALITTATYQAVLSPPGGLWQDTKKGVPGMVHGFAKEINGHKAGKTVLGTDGFDVSFAIFLIMNAAGFYGSLFVILLLTEGFPLMLEMGAVIVVLGFSYQAAMWSIIPDQLFQIIFIVSTLLLIIGIPFLAKKTRQFRIFRRQGHDICNC